LLVGGKNSWALAVLSIALVVSLLIGVGDAAGHIVSRNTKHKPITTTTSTTAPVGTGRLNCPQASQGTISYTPPRGTGPSAVEKFNFTYTSCTDTGTPAGTFTVNLTAKFTIDPNTCPWYSTGTVITPQPGASFTLTYSNGLAPSIVTADDVENSTTVTPFEAYWSFTSATVTGSFAVRKTPVFNGSVGPAINSFHLAPVSGSGCRTRKLEFYGVPGPAGAEDTLNSF